jgi:hypothetical protein
MALENWPWCRSSPFASDLHLSAITDWKFVPSSSLSVAYILHFSAVSILAGPNPFRREHNTLCHRKRREYAVIESNMHLLFAQSERNSETSTYVTRTVICTRRQLDAEVAEA